MIDGEQREINLQNYRVTYCGNLYVSRCTAVIGYVAVHISLSTNKLPTQFNKIFFSHSFVSKTDT